MSEEIEMTTAEKDAVILQELRVKFSSTEAKGAFLAAISLQAGWGLEFEKDEKNKWEEWFLAGLAKDNSTLKAYAEFEETLRTATFKDKWVKVVDLKPKQKTWLKQYWLDQGHPREFVEAML